MNTTRLGDELEERIHDLFQTEIAADRFWAKKSNCKVFRKKGYHSKDRDALIVFDVSVEMYLPGAKEYSAVMLIECKNYASPVPVNDIEEFFAKVQQVAAANAKAVIASTASFQVGTRTFAKSKGIGLLRYFDSANFKWELLRSASASARSTSPDATSLVEAGLSRQEFRSDVFDLYLQTPVRATNSLWDFVEDLVLDNSLTSAQVRGVINPRSRLANQVPFIDKYELESRSAQTLVDIGYSAGEVPLKAICAREQERWGLSVLFGVESPNSGLPNPTLGRIIFEPLQIQIFAQPAPYRARERFTLAHELGHHLLQHANFLSTESCDEEDFAFKRRGVGDGTDVARMEFQANFFAASLLLPRANIIEDFWQLIRSLDVPDKGFGALYVDNQPCNLKNYGLVTHRLMQTYGVSRTVVTIRLEALGLLQDARSANDPQPVRNILASSPYGTDPRSAPGFDD